MTTSPIASPLPGMVPSAMQRIVPVARQHKLARDTFLVRLESRELAEQAIPGQFFMIRSPAKTDPLLGRPFALYDTYLDEAGRPAGIDIVYVVIGKMTGLMSAWQQGDEVEVWGPLGNGFPLPGAGHLMLVAGGIGQTPFLAVAQEALGCRRYGKPQRLAEHLPSHVSMCYGTRSQDSLAGLDDFAATGVDLRLSTDDGSRGHHGLITDLLRESLASKNPPTTVYCCGPEPMMRAVSEILSEAGVKGFLSLETPMACGVGACFSCVARILTDDGQWDYQRTCVEGPVFPADRVILED